MGVIEEFFPFEAGKWYVLGLGVFPEAGKVAFYSAQDHKEGYCRIFKHHIVHFDGCFAAVHTRWAEEGYYVLALGEVGGRRPFGVGIDGFQAHFVYFVNREYQVQGGKCASKQEQGYYICKPEIKAPGFAQQQTDDAQQENIF